MRTINTIRTTLAITLGALLALGAISCNKEDLTNVDPHAIVTVTTRGGDRTSTMSNTITTTPTSMVSNTITTITTITPTSTIDAELTAEEIGYLGLLLAQNTTDSVAVPLHLGVGKWKIRPRNAGKSTEGNYFDLAINGVDVTIPPSGEFICNSDTNGWFGFGEAGNYGFINVANPVEGEADDPDTMDYNDLRVSGQISIADIYFRIGVTIYTPVDLEGTLETIKYSFSNDGVPDISGVSFVGGVYSLDYSGLLHGYEYNEDGFSVPNGETVNADLASGGTCNN